MLWFPKNSSAPPLVTTGPLDVLGPRGRPGTLGLPGTETLIGGQIGFAPSSGARVLAGAWLDDDAMVGLEGGYLFLARQTAQRVVSEPGTPGSRALAVPFLDAQNGFVETTTGVAFPRDVNPFAGGARLDVTTQLQGWEASGVYDFGELAGGRWQALVGYRYLGMQESLTFSTNSVNVLPAPPDVFVTTDQFRTTNDFHGGQLGLRAEWDAGPIFVRTTAKVALGSVHKVTTISGQLLTNDFTNLGPVQAFPGGYFAQGTNIGRHGSDGFAVVPEVGVNVGWQPVDGVRLTAGYTFLYISNVARPGDQIDRAINPSQSPAFFSQLGALTGPARPAFPGNESDFVVHGLSFVRVAVLSRLPPLRRRDTISRGRWQDAPPASFWGSR
ncbi:MAG: BBP7 family outer membrane beta-barrel protein [Gemmataceae bacterium]